MRLEQEFKKNTIIHNIKGYSIDGDRLRIFKAVVFGDGKILEIGEFPYLERKYPGSEIIDGAGNVLLPGLIDAHGHVLGLGYSQLEVNLTGTESLEEALERIYSYYQKYPDAQWILGRGWNQTHWVDSGFPTAKDLDAIISDKPIWLKRTDSHAGWANSKALSIAQISRNTENSEDGKILRDVNGNPSGVLIDGAMSLIDRIIPEHSSDEDARALQKALDCFKKVGLTSVHDAGISARNFQLYKDFVDQGKLTTRIYAMIGDVGKDFNEISRNGPIPGYGDDFLSVRSVKLFADGALGSRGAAMLQPYSDDPDNRGLLFYSQQELNKKVLEAISKNFQVNIHAIGDRANREVINAFETVEQLYPNHELRNRIEHAQIVSLQDIPRFKKLDLIASMQPTHATSDKNMAEQRIGRHRMQGAYAWQTFLKQGTIVAGGSDFPVESPNPFLGLYAAISRMDIQGNPPVGWYSNQKMTRLQAFRAFTIDAAYAAHQEKVIGSLEPGKWADFIIIDTDFFEAPEDQIWKIKVLQTWIAGCKIYDEQDA